MAGAASAQLTFEELHQSEYVNSFYGGGTGSLGSTGGPNFGVFLTGAYVARDSDAGGGWSFANEPSPSNVITPQGELRANVPAGFGCFSVYYTASDMPHIAGCWDSLVFTSGPDGTGAVLGTMPLDATTFSGQGDPTGGPNGMANLWKFKSIDFGGSTAHSVKYVRADVPCNYEIIEFFDDLRFGCPPDPCTVGACSPCDLNNDGMLGYEDELMFLCQINGAGCCDCGDFNHDGDCATDADIEAFRLCFEDPSTQCGRNVNDFCGGAINLWSALGTFPFDDRYACGSYFGTLANPSAGFNMWSDVWYAWHANVAGATRVTATGSFPIAIAVYTGSACPVTAARLLVGSYNGVADFVASTSPGDYLIRIGGGNGFSPPPIGGQGTFSITQCRSNGGTTGVGALYTLTGPPSNIPWSWLITSNNGTFYDLKDPHAGPVPSNLTTFDVAVAFASSINNANTNIACANEQVHAYAIDTGDVFSAQLVIAASTPYKLFVGAADTPATCLVSTTLPACTFNPTIIRHPDCGSADFNGDGDLGTDADIAAFFACLSGFCCPTCGSADFNGDGDLGTDADIESFFRVLGGGSC
jgi:hypothetical protein